jgi:hypothetical protein
LRIRLHRSELVSIIDVIDEFFAGENDAVVDGPRP